MSYPCRRLPRLRERRPAGGRKGTRMTTREATSANPSDTARKAIDRSAATGCRAGSIVLVLLVAAVLVAAAAVFMLIGARTTPSPTFSVSWRCWRRSACSRCLRSPPASCGCRRQDAGNPLIKSLVDDAFDGVVVTDGDGRVIYANAAYLDLIDAATPATCGRSSGSSSATPMPPRPSIGCSRRRARANACRRKCASPAMKDRPARWLRLRVRPFGDGERDARLTVWSLPT